MAALRNAHLGKGTGGILLQLANLDGALLGGMQVARTRAEVSRWADCSCAEAHWVLREDVLRSAVEVAVGDTLDKRLDIDVRGAAICARSVGTPAGSMTY